MEKTFKSIGKSLIILLMIYSVGSFLVMDLNINNWWLFYSIYGRIITIFIVFFIFLWGFTDQILNSNWYRSNKNEKN